MSNNNVASTGEIEARLSVHSYFLGSILGHIAKGDSGFHDDIRNLDPVDILSTDINLGSSAIKVIRDELDKVLKRAERTVRRG